MQWAFELPRSSVKMKRLRENEKGPDSEILDRTKLEWSEWREAMVPHDVRVNDPKLYSVRSVPVGFRKQHYYNQHSSGACIAMPRKRELLENL